MKKIMRLLVAMLIAAVLLAGCGANANTQQEKSNEELTQTEVEPTYKTKTKETNESASKNEPQKQTEPKETPEPKPKQQSEPVVINQTQEKEQPKQAAINNPSNVTPANQKVEQETKHDSTVNEVTITIKADAETGVILKATKVSIEEGDTVLELLKKVTKQNRIQMEYRGSGATAYIEGIQNLYEFDKGPKSGWMYSVNGVFMKKGAGTTEVKSGDKIEWAYTLDLGKDLGATQNE